MGASTFKIFRLLAYLSLAVHIFACTFYKIVVYHRSPEDVQSFLDAKRVSSDVSPMLHIAFNLFQLWDLLQTAILIYKFTVFEQNLSQVYVSSSIK